MRHRPSLTIETFFPKATLVAPRRDTPPLPATHMLPPELWRRVLGESGATGQLPALWRRCRQVCRTFRDIVDEIFEKKVLGDMVIEFDLDSAYMDENQQTDKVFFGFEMRFDRFADENKEIAIFKDDIDRTQRDPIWWARHDLIERRLLDNKLFFYTPGDATGAEAIDTRFDLPPWTVEIRGKINDTSLPGWTIDYSTREMSFRWRGAMSAFYREAEYIDESVMMAVGRAVVAGEYDELYNRARSGRISLAKHWLESTKIRENAAARARRQIRNHRMEQFWRRNYELDPNKHTYSLESLLEFRDQGADKAALRKMREMEWARSDGLLAAIPAYEGGDPLEDPMIENFIQRVFFDDKNAGNDNMDNDDAGIYADDDMEFTEGYMTDASTLATGTERSVAEEDFMPLEEELWTIEEEDDASMEEFESSGIDEVPTPPVGANEALQFGKADAALESEVAVEIVGSTTAINMPVTEAHVSFLQDVWTNPATGSGDDLKPHHEPDGTSRQAE